MCFIAGMYSVGQEIARALLQWDLCLLACLHCYSQCHKFVEHIKFELNRALYTCMSLSADPSSPIVSIQTRLTSHSVRCRTR